MVDQGQSVAWPNRATAKPDRGHGRVQFFYGVKKVRNWPEARQFKWKGSWSQVGETAKWFSSSPVISPKASLRTSGRL